MSTLDGNNSKYFSLTTTLNILSFNDLRLSDYTCNKIFYKMRCLWKYTGTPPTKNVCGRLYIYRKYIYNTEIYINVEPHIRTVGNAYLSWTMVIFNVHLWSVRTIEFLKYIFKVDTSQEGDKKRRLLKIDYGDETASERCIIEKRREIMNVGSKLSF